MVIHILKWYPLLNHWGWVTQICVGKLNHHCFRKWHVASPVPKHYLNQCWHIITWTLGNKLQWNLNRNSNVFIQENPFENVICQGVVNFPSLNVLTYLKQQWLKSQAHNSWDVPKLVINCQLIFCIHFCHVSSIHVWSFIFHVCKHFICDC